ncbi:sugar phosphate nucleotidyltransferase [Bacillus oleivorans]|uniref:sugar phosphate nucleotidyltransferase n=1 Tax=Bacillus oleivorans TaxID=1448271 RepID=UPI0015C8EF35|nr:sugar phosphate nucleotidyltransferase [Bacillus oleivorans]
MKTAIILAAGKGQKMWPYNEYRPKAILPVGDKPNIERLVNQLQNLQFERIFIVVHYQERRIRHLMEGKKGVEIISVPTPQGTADTLQKALEYIQDTEVLVAYGDIVITTNKLIKFIEEFRKEPKDGLILASFIDSQRSQDWFCANVREDKMVTEILGHPRPHYVNYQLLGMYCLKKEHIHYYVKRNPGMMLNVNVGMMPHLEGELEQSLQMMVEDQKQIRVFNAEKEAIDLDKPWHIMESNALITSVEVGGLKENSIHETASIHKTAEIRGYVKLGKNVKIGRNVMINGNVTIGDHTVIDNGAIIEENVMIGEYCTIKDYCKIGPNSVIGNRNRFGHCAEFQGVTFENVSFTHYGEVFGVVGSCTDIAAGVTVGILRFDDLNQVQRVNGRLETPEKYGNAVYFGDYTRTGISSQYMPGVKIGNNCVIGPAVGIHHDIPSGKLVYNEQQLKMKDWGSNNYGW